tara:strand:- start:107 stop:1369 length:1263 start_codon:yes stop_codon:yes gene_type:complete
MNNIVPIGVKPMSEDNVSNILLGLFLNYEFWKDHHYMVSDNYFEKESKKIFQVINMSHEKYERDLDREEVEALLFANNPLLTGSQRASILDITRRMESRVQPDIAKDILRAAFREHIGQTIANLGIAMMDGTEKDLSKVQELVERYQDGFQPDEVLIELSNEIDDIFSDEDDLPWKWNLTQLNILCPGIGPGTLTTIFALVETGKSAFTVSTAFGPDGFSEQGAKVMFIGNEEPAIRTQQRAVMSHTGLDEDRVVLSKKYVTEIWGKSNAKNNSIFRDATDYPTMESVEALVRKHKPDILIIDQLDKMLVEGTFSRDDLRLSEIYRRSRYIAKKHNLALIAVSQADATADGRTSLRFTQMANSKIGKAAEADVIIGIGKEHTDSGEDNFLRYLHVSKNKLGGRHGRATVRIEPEISRYVD